MLKIQQEIPPEKSNTPNSFSQPLGAHTIPIHNCRPKNKMKDCIVVLSAPLPNAIHGAIHANIH